MVKATFMSFAKKCDVSQHGLHGSHHRWQCFEGFGSPGCLCGMHHICQTKCKNPLLVNPPNNCFCSLTIKLDLALYALFEVSDSSSHLFSFGLFLQAFQVNLIITDYCMPGMTGYDLLKTVKVLYFFHCYIHKFIQLWSSEKVLDTPNISMSCNWNVLKLSFNAEEKHWFPWSINCTLLQGTAVDL
jgi:CheY-like chemotaxis protein